MKKLKFLTIHSLKTKLKSLAFIISSIITAVLIIIITLIPALITFFSPKEEVVPTYDVLLINQSDKAVDIKSYLQENSLATLVITEKEEKEDFIETFWASDLFDILIYYQKEGLINAPLIEIKDVSYYSKIDSYYNQHLKTLVANTKVSLLDFEQYKLTLTDHKNPELSGNNEESLEVVMAISSIVFTIVFFFIIFSTQTLGTEILAEKSTKAIETIISSVPAKTHFYSKIFSSLLFTLIQLCLMVFAALIGSMISLLIAPGSITQGLSAMIDMAKLSSVNIPVVFVYLFISTLFGVVLYLIYFAFLASFANNNEEYQKAQTPMMLLLLGIFYGSLIITMMNKLDLIRWLTYIPFFTPFLLPISLLTGQIKLLEGLLVLVVLLLSAYGSVKLILPAYRVSILDYSGGNIIKSIKRSYRSRKNN